MTGALCLLGRQLSPPVDHVEQLLALGRRRQVLVAVARDEDAVLDAHPADGVVALEHVGVDEARVHGVVEEVALEVRAAKVAARGTTSATATLARMIYLPGHAWRTRRGGIVTGDVGSGE